MIDGNIEKGHIPVKPRFNSEEVSHERGLFSERPYILLVSLVCLFLFAFAIRVYSFEGSSALAERQFRSALLARVYYYHGLESIPEWQKEVARISAQREDILEPPIMEFVVASIYGLVGGEHLWIARLLSTSFWIIGGIFVFKIAKRLISTDAAVYTTAYYLFVPNGIHISIGFLPDALMIMMLVCSIFAIVRYYEQLSTRRLMIAAIISGLAILVKPLCLFAIFGAFISLAIYKKVSSRSIINFLIFSACLVPAALYYLYGIFTATFLTTQAQVSFLPHLLLHPEYWAGWLLTGINAVGYTPLMIALLGAPLLRKGMPRTLLIGLTIGYVVFGLVFTYHIHFAPHYHLQLMLIVAFALGPPITLVINHLTKVATGWYWWVPITGVLLLMMILNIDVVRRELASPRYERKEVAQEIGEIVGHSTKTVFLASYYGRPLEYYGELTGTYWPRRATYWALRQPSEGELSVEERFSALSFTPEYFVITDFDEFDRHHADLKELLAKKSSLVAENDDYLIYDLKGVDLKATSNSASRHPLPIWRNQGGA